MARSGSYDKIVKYSVTAKCTEPLHVGSVSGDTEEIFGASCNRKSFYTGNKYRWCISGIL